MSDTLALHLTRHPHGPEVLDAQTLFVLGWLMGLKMADQVVDLIEKIQGASRAIPLFSPPVRAGLHETTHSHHSGAIPAPSQWLVTP